MVCCVLLERICHNYKTTSCSKIK